MLALAPQIREAADFIRSRWQRTPHAGIILGTGLRGLAQEIAADVTLDSESIPHFPPSTAVRHAGRLVCAMLDGVPVLAMEGRFHAYEGYPQQRITSPVRVMKA